MNIPGETLKAIISVRQRTVVVILTVLLPDG